VQAFQPLDPGLEIGRQGCVGQRSVGEQRLAALACHRRHGIKQGNVGRRPAIALVGVPALAMRILHRQAAIGGQWRVRPLRWRPVHRRNVGDQEDLRHLRVHRARAGQGVAIILDLRSEGAAEADQQLGLVGDFLQARDQQQAAGVGQDIGQSIGNLPSEWRFEPHRRAERGAGQRRCNFEIRAHCSLSGVTNVVDVPLYRNQNPCRG
jgi:hypothetical protein